MRHLLPAVLVTTVAACGGSPGAEPTTVPDAITATTAASTTTSVATTPTEARGLEGDELLACMVGGWTFDTEGFEAELQTHMDPGGAAIMIDVVSGGGTLVIGATRTFSLSYQALTIRQYLPFVTPTGPSREEREVVVSGEVASVFELDGNVFLPGDVDDPVLDIRSGLAGEQLNELPRAFGYLALRMGTRATYPYSVGTITIDCDGDRLVINDEVRIDPLSGGPSTIWLRNEGG